MSLLTEERIDQITDRLLIASQRNDEVISIKRTKAAIEDADRAIENLWVALEHGQSVEMITKRIDQRQKEKAELEEQLAKEELKFEGFDYTQIKAYLQHIKKLPGNELEKKRALISIFVNRIYLYDDHYTLILNGGNRSLELENIPIEVINSPGFPGETDTFDSSSLDTPAPPNIDSFRQKTVDFICNQFILFRFIHIKVAHPKLDALLLYTKTYYKESCQKYVPADKC